MIIKLSEWWCVNKSSMSVSASLKNPAFGQKKLLTPDSLPFYFASILLLCEKCTTPILYKKQKLRSTVGNDLIR